MGFLQHQNYLTVNFRQTNLPSVNLLLSQKAIITETPSPREMTHSLQNIPQGIHMEPY